MPQGVDKMENAEKIERIKELGKGINFELSPQTKSIVERVHDFPVEHFMLWFRKHYAHITGQHMLHYLSSNDGIIVAQGDKK
jgi:hypothetical protein